jgi:hypothetical protein
MAVSPVDALARGSAPTGSVATADPRNFSRMFRLPPFARPTQGVIEALNDIGRPGGVLDAKDALDRGPIDLIVDPALSAVNRDNPTHTAGTTFVGQFLDHDMTFDTASQLGRPVRPEQSVNSRTPALDLDTVYGRGPIADPLLYDPSDKAKLAVGDGGQFEDLPRTAEGTAIIGDPRNDENMMLAGIHVAFIMFHNRVVDMLRDRGVSRRTVFGRARRLVTWHYHWMILREFLPQIVDRGLLRSIERNGRRFYRPQRGQQSIPVEFQGAAYRFGHTMVRPSYRANLAGDNGEPFFGLIFDRGQESAANPDDLRGGFRAPRRFIGWQTFFDFADTEVRRDKRIDTHISTPLFNLPLGVIPSGDAPTALPQRNLLRHLTWSIPSGQGIAAAMGVDALGPSDFPELAQYGLGLEKSTPLWYYVLKEAEVMTDGLTLGPVGGRLVGEVFLGLMKLDPNSFMSASPRWRPTLPSRTRGDFRMVDLLTVAGVDPASRGQ